ncbi:MerR family transcriptional regulator [Enterococcus massiliensis]|uniref:MerR family transcriptional regulator n=1 Tax=Enterococcus massiliensis TaxID=1640685 RepID=UPI00065E38EE|nr:MerR family transcriptional regulator [Enterococcus massiliensis]
MEYTINHLAKLSGVSSRTLRYYDEIDLLKPKRINSSNYRIYGKEEVDRLQQILFLRKFGIRLEVIKDLLQQPDYDVTVLLDDQYQRLLAQKNELENLLNTLEKTIDYYKGEHTMTDKEKFDAFKQEKLQENETTYGEEIREKYGEEVVAQSNKKWAAMTEDQYAALQEAEQTMIAALNELLSQDAVDLDSQEAKTVFEAHKKWLTIAAPYYNAEYHRNLADMYVADERFAKYYNDQTSQKSVDLIRDIIYHYTAK